MDKAGMFLTNFVCYYNANLLKLYGHVNIYYLYFKFF